jgi:hypothetical protein
MKMKPALPFITALAGATAGYLAGATFHSPASSQPSSPPISSTALSTQKAASKDPKDKALASEGVTEKFTRLAATVSAADALAQAAAAGPGRTAAIRALLLAWIKSSTMKDSEKEWFIREVEETENKPNALQVLATVLRMDKLAAYRAPFMEAFRDSPLRSSMFPWLTGVEAGNHPEKLAEMCRDWMPWERDAFLSGASTLWAQNHPELALEWSRTHPGGRDNITTAAIGHLAARSPEDARKILTESTSPAERLIATRELARQMAGADTREAVEWADSLPEGPEKDAAHDAIYNTVPRGVGAVLTTSPDELPVVQNVIPSGPLATAGFQAGDMLAGVESAPGAWKGFSGAGLQDVVEQLRGEPGSTVTVVAMRRNAATGQWQEYRATVTREQIIFPRQNSPG